ncbi:hypothetical protein EUGRSUZ_F02619 [Eucalyptus grandis]|uniref:Uncharacterized protein n=2 Tax=Eucalyptus grandis TaxID=71139 RepID=A0ACC3KK61_EUCGR|nr:hypothetical protein EUGRSUZ_F02619 [Eucalyptus grandis]
MSFSICLFGDKLVSHVIFYFINMPCLDWLIEGFDCANSKDCSFTCVTRCSKPSRKNVRHRACKTCCVRCHCVPLGTYGNRSARPCYAELRDPRKQTQVPLK